MAPSTRALQAVLFAAWAVSALVGPAPIVTFNNEAQAAVREYGIPSQISSRVYSQVHVAHYIATKPGNNKPSEVRDAATAYAGHTVLSLLFPWRFARLHQALKPFVQPLSKKQAAEAEARGRAAAFAIIQATQSDGFARYVPFEPAPAGSAPCKYQYVQNQFKPAPPLSILSAAYTSALAEVFSLGKKESTTRTAYQSDTARFWADGPALADPCYLLSPSSLAATSSVAGHFNQIAQALLPSTFSTRATALLFAQLNAATWDASIAAYKAKYVQPFWRPITAIRQGDGSASNSAYVDAEWTPLLTTPSHPEHPSGHSATAGAAAAVIAKHLGANKPFTIGTEFPGLAPRSYAGIQEAVDEVNWSRVYAGVHFKHAVVEGAKLGAKVAEAVIARFDLPRVLPSLGDSWEQSAAAPGLTLSLALAQTCCCLYGGWQSAATMGLEALLARWGGRPPGGYLALCPIIKNQHSDLPEWLEYHRWLGVSHVYVMDDGSEPPLDSVLQPYIQEGWVTHRPLGDLAAAAVELQNRTCVTYDSTKPQPLAYNICLQDYGHLHTWIGYIDMDEFLVITDKTPDLPTLLRDYEGYGGVGVNWRQFGSSGHQTRQPSNLLAYTRCVTDECTTPKQEGLAFKPFIKTLANTAFAAHAFGAHHVLYPKGRFTTTLNGTHVNGAASPMVDFSRLALFHYVLKSRAEFVEKKARGGAMGRHRTDKTWNDINARASATCLGGHCCGSCGSCGSSSGTACKAIHVQQPSPRPTTAVGQGNCSGRIDAEWPALATTPSHPERPSGHPATTAAASAAVASAAMAPQR
ncbi:acid phosphatase Vanadium-dependent haloperoxidase [Micractinium conductrix]|uniref:Acid phosphatase Vanadium-dependent haloperoxidase n=1 Tax=Micractinium conductrix TaxID=554055 RepID=A0A2P6V5H7_9CHLO|nr:acid phosphatase Vanadium-dependent haloperoxidase [Micractinium conductrix]|eukprot:PSC69336.1 acid phosphatase Vanadium-dependent haloperoxidase [Micractinium conductrix]